MKSLTRFLFETSPFNEFWSAWLAGYAVIGADGQVYLTAAGKEYLETLR